MKNIRENTSENDFKVRQLTEWGLKKYTLDDDRVDIKLKRVWFETKRGRAEIPQMLAQIIFTAYRVKSYSPMPVYFGCFDQEKGAIIENHQVQEVFLYTDIDWTQPPSKLDQKTIDRISYLIKQTGGIQEYNLPALGEVLNKLERDGRLNKQHIDKNNFIIIYQEWMRYVGDKLNDHYFPKTSPISKADCYLADLMSNGVGSIAERLMVVLETTHKGHHYRQVHQSKNDLDLYANIKIEDEDGYNTFWNKYERPPKEEYQGYILQRRDLLQDANIRELKGAFFTPPVWSRASKDYFAQTLGDDWQDEYYIWDTCCGTGNLEVGLVNQSRIFMSTLDEQDLRTMETRKFMPNATQFQFDFVNDEFTPQSEGGKLPDTLHKLITHSPEKLVIYINPPYLEVGNMKQLSGTGKNREGCTESNLKQEMVRLGMGRASRELYMQFYWRICSQINGCKMGVFSTLKYCIGPGSQAFRDAFQARFLGGFVCRADTFDNVKGQFPIGFQIWDTSVKQPFPKEITFDILAKKEAKKSEDEEYILEGQKVAHPVEKQTDTINGWFKQYPDDNKILGWSQQSSSDFNHNREIRIQSQEMVRKIQVVKITKANILDVFVYNSVRLSIPATWINDRDQFLHPRRITQKDWTGNEDVSAGYEFEQDQEFISNCIVFGLFGKNYTDWQLFYNNEIGLHGVGRDMELYEMLLVKREKLGQIGDIAGTVVGLAREVYKMYHRETRLQNPLTNWQGVNRELKESKNLDYITLRKEFRDAHRLLAMEIGASAFRYGFLK